MSTKSLLAVERDGEVFELVAGESLRPGDRIVNQGTETATVGTLSKLPEYPSKLATLKPGQSVKVVDAAGPLDPVLGLEADAGDVAIEDSSEQLVAAADYTVTPEIDEEGELSGLFGAVPFLAGGAGLAAAAGAIGLAALAGSDDDENGQEQAGGGTAGGLVGGIEQLNNGISQTPLEPVTAVTEPVAGALGMVGDALLNSGEPTGLGVALGEIIGAPGSGTGQPGDGGLVGLVNVVAAGLDEAVSSSALEPLSVLVDPLSQTVGSDEGRTDGVAQGLANVGSSLSNDTSPLAPLTAELLGPVVGNSSGQDGGVPQTLDQAGEGLTDLTNPESALAPLSALTQPLDESVVQQVSAAVAQIGDALADASAQDPSGVVGLLADVLGAGADSSTASTTSAPESPLDLLAAGGQPGVSSTAGLPGADALTSILPG